MFQAITPNRMVHPNTLYGHLWLVAIRKIVPSLNSMINLIVAPGELLACGCTSHNVHIRCLTLTDIETD